MADYSLTDFVTPGQIKAQRDMAEALYKGAVGPPTPIKLGEYLSPWEIPSAAVRGYLGASGIEKAGQQERGSEIGGQRALPGAPGGPAGRTRVGGDDDTDPEGRALSSLESGGDYEALGPIIAHGSMAGDRAYGKYQVMGANIPKWTQKFLGHAMTPGQFLKDHDAQEVVRKGQMAEYTQQFGPEGAARAWLGGPGGVNHPERADQLGTTIGQYGKNFMARLASNAPVTPDTGPQAMAYAAGEDPNAKPAIEPPGSPGSAYKALMGGDVTKVAGGPRAGGGHAGPTGAGGEPGIPAGAVQPRIHMSREQFDRAMLSADPAMKAWLMEQFYSQHAPVPIVGPYGIPGYSLESGEQYFYPPAPTWVDEEDKTKTGPLEDERRRKVPYFTGVPTKPGEIPTITRGGPPEPAPAAPAPVAPTPPAPAVKPLDLSTPKKGSEIEGATKVASLEPGAVPGSTMTDAGPGGGPLAVKPPEGATAALSPDAKIIPTEAPPEPTAAPTKVAGAGDLRGMTVPERLEKALEYETEKERRTKEAEFSTKQLSEYGDASNRLMQSTNRLNQQINDSEAFIDSGLPVFGPYSKAKQDYWYKLKAAAGNKDAMNRISATEAFGKNVASEILSEMKTQLEKMGQVRIAEIDLLTRAMASTDNTPQSNKAILFVLKKITDQVRTISQTTEQYRQGVRWNADGSPIVDKDGNAILSKAPPSATELQGIIGNYVNSHPLYGDAETAQKLDILDPGGATRDKILKEAKSAAEKEKKAATPKAAAPAEEPTPKPTGRGPELPKGFKLNPAPTGPSPGVP